MQTKTCKRCGQEKSIDEFFKWKYAKDRLTYHCKPCIRLYNIESYYKHRKQRLKKTKEWSGKNKEHIAKVRAAHYQKNKDRAKLQGRIAKLARFGLTVESYDELFKSQNGLCAICEKPHWRNLAVDHDHKTGKVRGLLCYRCNTLLGLASDSIQVLQSAILYLKT